MRTTSIVLAALAVCCGLAGSAAAQELKLQEVKTATIGLGETAVVKIANLGAALAKGKPKLADFVLYLDGHAVASGAEAGLTNAAKDELGFTLTRTNKNNTAWTALLGSPTAFHKTVQVDVGLAGQSSVLPTEKGAPLTVTLAVVRSYGLVLGVVFILAVAVAIFILGKRSDLFRDREPADFGGATAADRSALRRPFSLSLSQMGWWLVLVLSAYIFLFAITGDINTLTTQALTLMGIGTGTALGASMIQNAKTDATQKEFKEVLQRIAENQAGGGTVPPADIDERDRLARRLASSGNYFIDILTDENGVSLHRFQVLAWSVVIGFIFLVTVYRELALPTFDGTILAVLGISAGTYLGFKVPEKPV